MSDTFCKTIGVQKNMIIRGKPLLTEDDRINPTLLPGTSDSVRKELAELKAMVEALKSKPAPAPKPTPTPTPAPAPKPTPTPAPAPKPAATKPAANKK